MAKLILIRHGQSIWNLQNRFTGWIDVCLSKQGIQEAQQAAQKLKNYKFDIAFTSTLIRAQDTLTTILRENTHTTQIRRIHEKGEWYSRIIKNKEDENTLEIHFSDKLNERFYGDLQGLNKEETAQKYGKDQVHIWRRSFNVAPPNGESLEMTSKRTIPYYKKKIEPLLKQNKTIIISAHGNSLRSIIMHLEQMTPEQILEFEIKTGTPHIYDLNENLKITKKEIL